MISTLQLQDFRNFAQRSFKFSPDVTAIVGANGSGKTNILEALHLLSTGKSFKAKVEEEMIAYKAELARVAGTTTLSGEQTKLEAVLTRGIISKGRVSQKTARKRLLVGGAGKRLVDFSGVAKTVLFKPSDMDLVNQSPSLRRSFMNTVLSQTSREYRRSLLSYENGLRRRNKILLRIREEGIPRTHLFFWDNLLIKNGNILTAERQDLVDFINETEGSGKHKLHYDRSIISEARLAQYAREEVAAGTTLVGPHRDDFLFFEGKRELARFGSRGEQRMAVLWLKLAELAFMENRTGDKPTLMLDDIFSELDHKHRDIVAEVAAKQQTILTTADEHYLAFKTSIERIDL